MEQEPQAIFGKAIAQVGSRGTELDLHTLNQYIEHYFKWTHAAETASNDIQKRHATIYAIATLNHIHLVEKYSIRDHAFRQEQDKKFK